MDFFQILCIYMLVAVPLGTIQGNAKFLRLLFKQPMRGMYHFKGPYLKKKIQGQNVKNLSFFWKIEHFISLIHCEKIESLNKNLFYIYFFLSKKYLKKVFTSTHR